MTVKVINTLNDYFCYYDNIEKLGYFINKHNAKCDCPTCETTKFLLKREEEDLRPMPVYAFQLITKDGREHVFDSSIGTQVFLLNEQGKTIDKIWIEHK